MFFLFPPPDSSAKAAVPADVKYYYLSILLHNCLSVKHILAIGMKFTVFRLTDRKTHLLSFISVEASLVPKSITAAETADYAITAVNAEGVVSEPITAALTVQAASQRPGFGGWLDKIFSRWF